MLWYRPGSIPGSTFGTLCSIVFCLGRGALCPGFRFGGCVSEKVSKEYWVLSSIIRRKSQGKRNAGYSYVITDAITGNTWEHAISKISESSDIYRDAKAIQEAFRISPDKLTGTVQDLHHPFSRNLLRFFFRIGVYGNDEKAGEIWTFICRFHFNERKARSLQSCIGWR